MSLFSYPFVQIALLASLVLAGIHSYLGFHVVSRGVIFVDISLAQAAAFGGVVATLMGLEYHSMSAYFVSLMFTLAAAGIISISRMKDNRIPQEAFIGIIYAGFSAGVMLLLSGHPGGMEELEHTLAGSLMTITPRDLWVTAIIYGAIGIFHYIFRRQFFAISEGNFGNSPKRAGWWDFLFYATFGLVVTSSVHMAGVLLVFSLLVVPPVTALIFARQKGLRLFLGWLIAFAGSTLGIALSVSANLPTGPSIIAVLITILILSILLRQALAFGQARLQRPGLQLGGDELIMSQGKKK
jgi:zinc/manganese transport system permease protein